MSIQMKRLELELSKTRAARLESELRLMERQEEMARIQANQKAQSDREAELEIQIEELKAKGENN